MNLEEMTKEELIRYIKENIREKPGRKKIIDEVKIKELRKNGFTQEAIARELNVSLSSVRRSLKN